MIEDLNDKSESNEDFFLNGEYFFDGSPSSNEPPSNVYKSTNQDDINKHKNINQANNSKTFIEKKDGLQKMIRMKKKKSQGKPENTKKMKFFLNYKDILLLS